MRARGLLSLFVGVLLTLSPQLRGADEPNNVITACIIDVPYWSHIDGDKSKGVYPDVYRALFRNMKVKRYHVVALPYARLNKMLKDGKCDISSALLAENKAAIKLGYNYWSMPLGFVTLAKAHHVQQQLQQQRVNGLIVGVLDPQRLGHVLADTFNPRQQKNADTLKQLLQMLNDGEVDVIYGDLAIIAAEANAQHIALGKHWVIDNVPLYFMMSKHSSYADDFDAFNQQWQKLIASGYFRQRVIKHRAQ